MKEVTNMACQGDVLFRKVAAIPPGFEAQPDAARTVVSHSQYGHDHSVDAPGVRHFVGKDPLVSYLQLASVPHADVVHHRAHDTHETIRLTGGEGSVFEVRRQREATVDSWQRVDD